MRLVVRLFAVCLLCCVVSVLGWSEVSFGAGNSALGGLGGSGLEGPLVVSTAEPLVGSQAVEVEAVKRASPEAVAAREASSSAYENLTAEGSEKLIGEVYPWLVSEPWGGPPRLAEGESILSYPTDNAAALALPGGKHGVLSSQAPIAIETPGGQRLPIDLSLTGVGGGFQPKRPLSGVQVRIPERLADGPSLEEIGVSLTPVDEGGAPLSGAGILDGVSVFYGDTEAAGVSDLDMVVKPGTFGLSEEAILRSQRSPQALFFKVGLPEDASLVQDGSGPVEVLDAGQVVGLIVAPSARDAEGTAVPTSVSVSGDVVKMTVAHTAGEYRMPILVDPTVTDKRMILATKSSNGNVTFGTDNEAAFEAGEWMYEGLRVAVDEHVAKASTGQFGFLEYPTQRESRIYEFTANTQALYGGLHGVEGVVYIEGAKGVEDFGGTRAIIPWYGEGTTTVCVLEGCAVPSVSEEHHANGAFFELYAYTNTTEPTSAELKFNTTSVQIAQERAPSASIDTIDSLFGSAPNGAFPGQWVKASAGKVGFAATDPGIGVSAYSITSPQAGSWGHREFQGLSGCEGVQCDECWNWASKCEAGHSSSNEPLTYSLSGLPDGKDTVEAKVEDATGLSAAATGTVEVDSTAPHGLALTGLPSNKEIGEGTYTFTAEATDGEGATESSGIASISLSVDGQPLTNPTVKCSPGPCTGKGTWSINGFAIGTGYHTITIVAICPGN